MDTIQNKKIQLKEQHLLPPNLHDIRNGLVLDLPFSESGDTVIDQSQNGNHGDIIGATRGQGLGDGRALVFDGADDYVRVDTDESFVDAITLFAVWKIPYNFDPGVNHSCVRLKFDSNDMFNAYFPMFYNSNNQLTFYVNKNGVGSVSQSIITDIMGEKFISIAFVLTNNSSAIYLNGKYKIGDDSFNENVDISTLSYFQIGASSNSVKGVFDSARIYNRALSVQEIRNLYLFLKKKAGLI